MATYPGNSYRFSTDYRTGEPQMWQQTARLASTVGEVVSDIWIRQADDQFSTYKVEMKRLEGEMATELTKNQDETKYDSILEKYRGMARSLSPKNPLAARMSSKYYESKNVNWEMAIKAAKEDRLTEKWEIKRDALERDFITTGVGTDYIAHEFKGVALHNQDESQARERIEKAKHLAERQRMESIAGNNPDWILENIRSPADMKKHFPDSLPAEYSYIRGLAINQINFIKRQEDAAMSAFYDDVTKKAEEGMPPGEMRELLLAQPGLTTQERTKAMRVFSSAYNTWSEGGTKENPWKTTQDYNALMKMQVKISRGEPVTEMDIIRAQLAEPDKGPLFSNSDRNNLFTQLPDNDKKPELKTPFAILNQDRVETLFKTEEYEAKETVSGKLKKVKRMRIPPAKYGEYQSKLNEINALISAYKDNPVRAQKEIDESLTGLREENVLQWWENFLSPLITGFRFYETIKERPVAKKSPYSEYPDAYFVNGEWRVMRDGVEYRIE